MFGKLRIYNTLSGKKEILKPLKNERVNLFVCGPTVYDFSHIGHARTCIIFDCFVKYLSAMGFKVFYLQNITDIDDKIIARAKESQVTPKNLAKTFEKDYFKNMKLLGVNSVNKYARATDYIKEIISQVKRLLDKGYAYKLEDGIYYNIKKFQSYGKLSGRTVLQADDAVSRIDYSKNKKNRGDFCLWKFSRAEEPSWSASFGLPSQLSPDESWEGAGRPGWHIEDTAITEKFFGPQYDIHGGSRDLIFPHHEAEISQMEAISGKKPMAKYWMHTGFLTIEGQKMSKSLNNFITIEAFLKRYPYRYLRFWIAKNLWRSPINYSESTMLEVKSSLEKIGEFLRKIQIIKNGVGKARGSANLNKILKDARTIFYKSLDDNFNTPKAFAAVFELVKKANTLLDQNVLSPKNAADTHKFFEEIDRVFGFIDFDSLKKSNVPDDVKKLFRERENYRKSENWAKADEVRIEIEKYGFSVEDTKSGTVIKKM